MTNYRPLEQLPEAAGYKNGDVLVLVGELFGRGYANGLIDEARRLGMTVIGTTVGRRDGDGTLRPLTDEELSEAQGILGSTIINIPLEAGFDMEPACGLPSVSEQLKKLKTDEWQQTSFSDEFIAAARTAGTSRFRAALSRLAEELESRIQAGANVLFAHSMAGGIPRARVLMPLLNRVFKGTGDKFLASADFWVSNLGRLCDASFNEVTADTFRYLIEETSSLRNRIQGNGGQVRYAAYGYHGTSVLVGGDYRWQSYTPYVQGWAKMRLEDIAAEFTSRGTIATVFNCPEILTNSSALFLGVEISLYPLLTAIRREAGAAADRLFSTCQEMLKEGETVQGMLKRADAYLSSPLLSSLVAYDSWPQHNTREQAELMLASSADLMGMHADQKRLVCAELSRIVFLSTGRLMLHGSWAPAAPALWLNHDIIARLVTDPRGAGIL